MANRALIGAAFAALLLLAVAPVVTAQSIEIAPFVGARAGGDVFDVPLHTVYDADVDHAASAGVVVNVPLWEGLQIEGEFSHQPVSLLARPDAVSPPVHFHGAVDHWQGGVLQEYFGGAVRPFLTGVLGVTRYAIEGDSEYRFTTGAGGGVKLFPARRFGVRLDGRLFATFLDATTTSGVCGGSGCLLGVHLDVAWQFEVTAALVVRIGPLDGRSRSGTVNATKARAPATRPRTS